MIEQIRRHVEQRFSEAEVAPLPFPHLVIENFFPDDVYAKMLEYNLFKNNKGKEWISKGGLVKMKTTTPYDHRTQINFHAKDEYEAPPEVRKFWEDITHCFIGDDWFVMLVHDKYPAYFEIRFGEFFTPENLSHFRKQLFLQQHEPGYYIGPHTDIPTRIFTCLFSLAERPGYEEYGTQLLRHKDPLKRCWGNDHYGFEDFDVVSTAPYHPNNFLLFFKTRQSFHAVKTIPDDVPNRRYGMQFQFYEKADGTFVDLSKQNLYVSEHQNSLGKIIGKAKKVLQGA